MDIKFINWLNNRLYNEYNMADAKEMAASLKIDISKYDPKELVMGINVEKEHNKDKDIDVVKKKEDVLKIALAHLREDPKYYTKLKKVEA